MEILIPSLLRIKPQAINKVGKYLHASGFLNIALIWGDGLKERFGSVLRVSFDATDVNVVFEDVAQSHDVETLFQTSIQLPPRIDALLAVGGGRAIDCAKYLGHLVQKPVIVLPTAISNDGFCSPFSSLLVRGQRRTMRTVLPEGIVLDTEILAACPEALLYSGIGDLFCKYTAIFDWKLAYKRRREPVNDFAAETSRNCANTFLYFEPKTFANLEYLKILASSLMMAGIAMEIAGSSRPASGAEHQISHAYDRLATPPSLHGLQVGVASYLTSLLQEATHEQVARAANQSGFIEYVAAHPLKRDSFIEAIKAAPFVKADVYTILSEPGAVEKAIQLCDSDPTLTRLLSQ